MNLLIYSIMVALACGVIAGITSTHALRSRIAMYLAAALGSMILAILAIIGIFYLGAALQPEAPFDAIASIQAAGKSVWMAILLGLLTTGITRKVRNMTE
jgi:hypothetical protein